MKLPLLISLIFTFTAVSLFAHDDHVKVEPRNRNLPVYAYVVTPDVPAQKGKPALFYVYGLQTDEEVAIFSYYLQTSWISYPMRDGIYEKPDAPVAYAEVKAPIRHAPNGTPVPSAVPASLIGYDYTGRPIYASMRQ